MHIRKINRIYIGIIWKEKCISSPDFLLSHDKRKGLLFLPLDDQGCPCIFVPAWIFRTWHVRHQVLWVQGRRFLNTNQNRDILIACEVQRVCQCWRRKPKCQKMNSGKRKTFNINRVVALWRVVVLLSCCGSIVVYCGVVLWLCCGSIIVYLGVVFLLCGSFIVWFVYRVSWCSTFIVL